MVHVRKSAEWCRRGDTKWKAHQRHHQIASSRVISVSRPSQLSIIAMSATAPARSVTRSCQLAARQQYSLSSQCLRISSQQSSKRQRRWQSTDAAQPTNPKIATIVDQISALTLLETADLVQSLKVCSLLPPPPIIHPAHHATKSQPLQSYTNHPRHRPVFRSPTSPSQRQPPRRPPPLPPSKKKKPLPRRRRSLSSP